MIEKDTYLTIQRASTGTYKAKGSKFFAYAHPVKSEDECKAILEMISKEHPKSRHCCYAYRMGIEGDLYRINDDGEPSGTAGKPIYGQLLSNNVSDILVAVIRYFGGTKLGVPGLIHAYKTSAADAITNATIVEKTLMATYEVRCHYELMGPLLEHCKKLDLTLLEKTFMEDVKIVFELPLTIHEAKITRLKAKLLNKSTEEIDAETTIPSCTISLLELTK